jgi:hypothetical protein
MLAKFTWTIQGKPQPIASTATTTPHYEDLTIALALDLGLALALAIQFIIQFIIQFMLHVFMSFIVVLPCSSSS